MPNASSAPFGRLTTSTRKARRAESSVRQTLRQLVHQLVIEGWAFFYLDLPKTVRTCRQLLKVEPALWLFVTVEGVEPTNNAAQRAIRPAVIWRRTSFGSQTQAGSVFVARMLTVVTTLRSQRRNVLDFLTLAMSAARTGKPTPSLLRENYGPNHT